MGRSGGWVEEQTGRALMPSSGRPGVNQLEAKQAFWKCIAEGMQSEAAASACGVSQPLGPRWFRDAGGSPPISLVPHSGRYLSFAEREEIALLKANDAEFARLPGSWAGRPRPSHANCAVMLRPAVARCSIGLQSHSGKLSEWPSVPSPPSLPKTSAFERMCKTGSPGWSRMPRADRFRDPTCHGRGGAMAGAPTGAGAPAGARGRLAADCESTSRMMHPCASPTKPSTKRSMCKVVVRCDANCPPVCVPAERCGRHVPGRGNGASSSLSPR